MRAALARYHRRLRRERRVFSRCHMPGVVTPTRLCLKCGYVLDGLPVRRCPECGDAFDPADPRTSKAPSDGKSGKRFLGEALIGALIMFAPLRVDLLTPRGMYAHLCPIWRIGLMLAATAAWFIEA